MVEELLVTARHNYKVDPSLAIWSWEIPVYLFLGGLTAGGLGWTDSGRKEAVGGIAREFYQHVKKHYDRPEAWVHQRPEEYSRYRVADDAMLAEQGGA